MCTLVGFPCASVQIQVALAGLCTLSKDKKKDIELKKSVEDNMESVEGVRGCKCDQISLCMKIPWYWYSYTKVLNLK